MVMHFWQKQQKRAEKLLRADIKHNEELGQGTVAIKKKKHLQELMHKIELMNEKVAKTEKKDLQDE